MIPSDFIPAINLRNVSRTLGVRCSAALRGIILRGLCDFFVEKYEFIVWMGEDTFGKGNSPVGPIELLNGAV